jgi:hypothetical protein
MESAFSQASRLGLTSVLFTGGALLLVADVI